MRRDVKTERKFSISNSRKWTHDSISEPPCHKHYCCGRLYPMFYTSFAPQHPPIPRHVDNATTNVLQGKNAKRPPKYWTARKILLMHAVVKFCSIMCYSEHPRNKPARKRPPSAHTGGPLGMNRTCDVRAPANRCVNSWVQALATLGGFRHHRHRCPDYLCYFNT